MRYLLLLWFIPVSFLSIWYGLSYYDINLGTTIFSRQLHDLVFNLYGKILGIAPGEVPILAAKAIAFDTLIVFAIVAYRMRKSWWPKVRALFAPPVSPALNTGAQGNSQE